MSVTSGDERVDLLTSIIRAVALIRFRVEIASSEESSTDVVLHDLQNWRRLTLQVGRGEGIRQGQVIIKSGRVRVYHMHPNPGPKKIWTVS
jgi:hypothetical protein